MKRAIVTYAAGAHEELLDVALPGYKAFAQRHGYELIVGDNVTDLPPAWNKVSLLMEVLLHHEEVVLFDCDLIVVNSADNFPSLRDGATHALVRHFDGGSEVPNSGVWWVTREIVPLLAKMMDLEVFRDHGWWEQAALMTMMGYTVPPQGSDYRKTQCRNVVQTRWFRECQFMRLAWNSHPNYRAERPRIVHCSYSDMSRRLEVMRALARDPAYDYPRFEPPKPKVENKDEEATGTGHGGQDATRPGVLGGAPATD